MCFLALSCHSLIRVCSSIEWQAFHVSHGFSRFVVSLYSADFSNQRCCARSYEASLEPTSFSKRFVRLCMRSWFFGFSAPLLMRLHASSLPSSLCYSVFCCSACSPALLQVSCLPQCLLLNLLDIFLPLLFCPSPRLLLLHSPHSPPLPPLHLLLLLLSPQSILASMLLQPHLLPHLPPPLPSHHQRGSFLL